MPTLHLLPRLKLSIILLLSALAFTFGVLSIPVAQARSQIPPLAKEAHVALPSSIYTVTNLNASGAGSLLDALTQANANAGADTINFSVDGTIVLTGTLTIADDVTIDGNGHSVTVSGNGSIGVFAVNYGVNATINALTIANGSSGAGGGILNSGMLTVTSSTLSGNSAVSYGGGIYNSGTLNVNNSTIGSNGADQGGGIYNYTGVAYITNSDISGNGVTTAGGGIWNNTALNVSNSNVSGNGVINISSAIKGGGIYNQVGSLHVNNSTFAENFTGYGAVGGLPSNNGGGGIYNYLSTDVDIVNSTFFSNTSYNGGGIYDYQGGVLIINSTFNSNSGNQGGGIGNVGTIGSNQVNLANTILANSSGGNCFGYIPGDPLSSGILADSYTLTDGGCKGATVVTTAQLNLQPLANNGGPTWTIALGAGSVAIDAANDVVCPATDQRGIPRPQGAHCDVGAYESTTQLGPGLIVNTTADTDDGACDLLVVGMTNCTLREAINASNAYSGTPTITFGIPVTDTGCVGTACTVTLASTLPVLNNQIKIDGSSQPITVSGSSAYRVLTINTGKNVILNALTIANGYGPDCGGYSCGGGIYNGGNLTVTNSTLLGNTAPNYGFSGGHGGGIYNAGTLTLTNSTLYGNTAPTVGIAIGLGGGVYNSNLLNVFNSTFYGNSAFGSGIYNASGTANLSNTIIVASNPMGCLGTINANSYNLNDDGTCGSATVVTLSQLNLQPLANNGGPTRTMALGFGSVAINKGNNAFCPATDQRGIKRPEGLICDVGAYELQYNFLFLPFIAHK